MMRICVVSLNLLPSSNGLSSPWWALGALIALLTLSPVGIEAQSEATPQLRGVVERSGVPLGDAPVVLHRVDAVDAGELDSLRTSADGGFVFDLPTVPDPEGRGEIYFASVMHEGVLYFGSPVATAIELDSIYRIQVYDTVAAPVGGADLTVEVRYLLIEEVTEGWEVTDLIQLLVAGDRTLVPAEEGVTWSYRIPVNAEDIQVGGGDIAPVSTLFTGDTVGVTMPLSPGMRQMVLRYRLDSLDLSLPLPGVTNELEILVRQPSPGITAAGLIEAEPVEMEPGVAYRRFAAAQLSDSTVSLVGVPGSGGAFRVEYLMVLLGLILTGAGIWAVKRAPKGNAEASDPSPAGPAPTVPDPAPPMTRDARDRLLLQLALMDERIEQMEEGPERTSLREEREALKRQLAIASGR